MTFVCLTVWESPELSGCVILVGGFTSCELGIDFFIHQLPVFPYKGHAKFEERLGVLNKWDKNRT